MTLPNLISFSGYAGSGKDAAAEIMAARARYVKTTMTTPLEQTLVKLNPWVEDDKEGTIERFADLYENLGEFAIKEFSEARRLMLALETEVGRENDGNMWLDLAFAEVQRLLSLNKKVALSGVLHAEELNLVRKFDGVCVWINRPGVKARSSRITIHPTDCDVAVVNNGTVKDLYVNIVVALEEYNQNLKENDNVG